jgi:hypothetical protein
MKKKILSGVFALAIMVTAGYGVNKSMNGNANLSDLTLSNVEALAQNEGGGIQVGCQYAKKTGDPNRGNMHWRCESCKYELCYKLNGSSKCTVY